MLFDYLKSLYNEDNYFELVLIFSTGIIFAFCIIFSLNFCWSLVDTRKRKTERKAQEKQAIFDNLIRRAQSEAERDDQYIYT